MSTQQELGYPALRDAFAIIDGIPDRAFDLDSVLRKKGQSLQCGTIACAAGWLGLHPTFLQERGIKVEVEGTGTGADLHYYIGANEVDFDAAMAKAFGISEDAAYSLFAPVYNGSLNGNEGGDHKTIWKKRVLAFLQKHSTVNPKAFEGL